MPLTAEQRKELDEYYKPAKPIKCVKCNAENCAILGIGRPSKREWE